MSGTDGHERVLELLQRTYPGWMGFSDPRLVKDEIAYKQKAARKVQESLSREALAELIAAGQYDEILKRIKSAAATNLLYTARPRAGDTNILTAPDLDMSSFAAAFLDLLWGMGDAPARLGRYLAYVRSRALPNKWVFPTYFLFLSQPKTEVFVKPEAASWVCSLLGHPEAYAQKPSAESYEGVRSILASLRDALSEYGPTDMIGVQSVVWVCFKTKDGDAKGQSVILPERHDELAELVAEFRDAYVGSDAGRANFVRYAPSREAGRRNFEEIATSLAAGKDITEDVLLRLLPYDAAVLRNTPRAWTHVAPVFAVDVRRKFEGSGWVRKQDWPDVARTIFGLAQAAAAKPDEIGALSSSFAASWAAKGFQTGTLSPILNALRPDEFLIINNKPRAVINYLTGKTLHQNMSDYPELNRLGRRIIEELAPELVAEGHEGVLPSDVFDQFCHWLVAVKKLEFSKVQYWKVAPGENGRLWDDWRDGGYIAIGWDELGDLSALSRQEFVKHRDAVIAEHPDWTAAGIDQQVWRFAKSVSEGDRVVANNGTREVLGIGTVTGPYYFQAGEEYSHRLPVEWGDVSPRAIDEPGWRKALIKLDRAKFEEIVSLPPESPPAPYSVAMCASETGFEIARLEQWARAIERKKQAIVYGPPGTGKTFVAERLARHLVAGGDGFQNIVQFHPSYAYEDFIQGIRPETNAKGQLEYPMKEGRFIEFCREARERTGRCVLIIDEINRANLSRVFGELMYLLEYRNQDIPLAGGNRFSIPENVRLIGTMNTADRSIALVDHALRRRFAFLPLYPDYGILARFHSGTGYNPAGLIGVLEELNRQIGDRHYEVGITYFLSADIAAQIEDVWHMEIEPYLDEYFFDQPDKAKAFGWDRVGKRVTGNADGASA